VLLKTSTDSISPFFSACWNSLLGNVLHLLTGNPKVVQPHDRQYDEEGLPEVELHLLDSWRCSYFHHDPRTVSTANSQVAESGPLDHAFVDSAFPKPISRWTFHQRRPVTDAEANT
jgi:hypothetical protein